MPAERAPMRKVREVLRLRHALGVSERQIAVTIGVSRSTVGEYLRRAAVIGITWPMPEGLDDTELERRLFTSPTFDEKPARPLPDWSHVHKELKRRAVTLLLLWEEYRAEHTDGYGYSRFCDLYRDWCKTISPTMRQTHAAGEKLFVDFAGDTVPVFDAAIGIERRAHIFVAVLGASNYTYAEARWSEGLADWIGAHVNAFSAIGGVPKAVVCDNLKAGVTVACRYEPGINRTYQELAEHYDTAILPTRRGGRATRPRSRSRCKLSSGLCWPGCATTASSRSTSSMPRSARPSPISTPRSCASSASAATSCSQRSIGRHSMRFRPRPISMPSGRSAGSRPTTTLRSPITITPCRHASSARTRGAHHRHHDRDPAQGCRVASHARSHVRRRHTTIPEHMPSAHRRYAEWTPARMRREAAKIGPATIALVEAIMKAKPHPEQGFRACLGILRLARSYGSARIEAACRRGNDIGATNYGSINSILQHGLDRAYANEKPPDAPPIQHRNIRGTGYYH